VPDAVFSPRLGVCSWSLQPRSEQDLARLARQTGVACVQLGLKPLLAGQWSVPALQQALADAGQALVSGMLSMAREDYSSLASIALTGGLRPDATWKENRRTAAEAAVLARRLGLSLVSFHAGFLPHEPGRERDKLLERLRQVADLFAEQGVAVALETGQETAETLEQVLVALDRPHVGVNFDPANMLLYGMGEPLDALQRLLPSVRQVHIKDACRTSVPGTWGREVPVGSGEVDWRGFLELLSRCRPVPDLLIEREDGARRVADVTRAREHIEHCLAARRAATVVGPGAPADAPRAARPPVAASVGVGVLGLGFMGGRHIDAYRVAQAAGLANHLVAVSDADADRRRGARSAAGHEALAAAGSLPPLFDPREVVAHADPAAVLSDPAVELVSICTWTESHVPLALAALAAGKHVLVEKPLALHAAEVARLAAEVQRHPDLLCMPAMCMRFWPGWSWLAEIIAEGRFGPLRTLELRRLAPAPNWSAGFYADEARSGGMLVDLHVHDADFIRWCLGPPVEVSVTGHAGHVHVDYRYADPACEVRAEAAWLPGREARFSMSFRAVFEGCIVDYASGRDPLLRVERRHALVEPVALEEHTGYEHEIQALLAAIHALRRGERPPPLRAQVHEAVGLMRLLAAERESLLSGRPVAVAG